MYFYQFGYYTHEASPREILTHENRYLPEEFKAICNDVYKKLNKSDWVENYWREAIDEMLKLGFKKLKPECSYLIDGWEPFKPVE